MNHRAIPRQARTVEGWKRWKPMCSCGWSANAVTKHSKAQEKCDEHLGSKAICPTPSKKKFRTKMSAEKEMETYWRTSRRGGKMPTRTYLCPCGRYHMTAQPLRGRSRAA